MDLRCCKTETLRSLFASSVLSVPTVPETSTTRVSGRGARRKWPGYVVPALLCGVALAVRIGAATNEMWLDEIWSLQLAQQVTSAFEVFGGLHHDNNHYLITFWMWGVGTAQHALVYRLPSILAGCLSVLFAGRLARPWGRAPEVTTMVLFATSYLMIQYSSEARGYALAVMWALAGHLCLRAYLGHGGARIGHVAARASRPGQEASASSAESERPAKRSVWQAALFGTCIVCGFLSHLAFLQYYLAAFFWSSAHLAAEHRGWRRLLRELTVLHAIPAVALGTLYLVDVRHLDFGGGPNSSLGRLLLRTMSLAVGGPMSGPFAGLCAGALLIVVGWGLTTLLVRGDDEWKFFACAIFLFPVIQLCVLPPAAIYERFYLINVAWALLLTGLSAGNWLPGPNWRTAVALVGIGAALGGNARHVAELYRDGRGNYAAAVRLIATETQSRPVQITSDHDFRNPMLLKYYASRSSPHLQFHYVPLEAASQAEWLLVHRWPFALQPGPVTYVAPDGSPLPQLAASGQSFTFRAAFPAAKLSGCEWLLYRRNE